MRDVEAEKRHLYSFAYQFSHITRDRDSLPHDDRLDAVAGLMRFWEDSVGINPERAARQAEEARAKKELDDLLSGAVMLHDGEIGGDSKARKAGSGHSGQGTDEEALDHES
jgi:hypothetical protein